MSDHHDDSTAPSLDEAALVRSCQAGTLADFDPLYTAYVHRIYGFLYRRTLHRATAEDLTSTVFMKALEKIGSYKPSKGPFGAWMFGIARNTLTDHYRQLRPTKDLEDVWDLAADDTLTHDLDTTIDFAKIKTALSDLPADKREIVLLRLWDNLSYKEIAELTGKSEGNCKVIFCRTLETLRKTVPLSLLALLLHPPFST